MGKTIHIWVHGTKTRDELSSGKSNAAFSKNVATEVAAGKPQKQAVAIAYAKRGEGKDEGTAHDPKNGQFTSSGHHTAMDAKHEAAMKKAKPGSDEHSLHSRGMNLHKKAAMDPRMSAAANAHSASVAAGTASAPMGRAEAIERAKIKFAPNGAGSRIQGGVKA